MTARATGSLFAGAAAAAVGHQHTNQQPVWRCSYDVDDPRSSVGKPYGNGTKDDLRRVTTAIGEALTAWANKIKVPGKAHAITQGMIHTLRTVLFEFTTHKTGECTPSLDQIAEKTGYARMTVIRHLKALRTHKWLDWVRRTEPTGNSPKDGPTVKQASNAYFFEISRLPLAAQIEMKQILKRMKVKLAEHPDRQGSGSVPNRVQRMASRMANQMRDAFVGRRGTAERRRLEDDAAFVRAEMALMGDIPTDRWASVAHPDDPAAQEAYNRRLGIDLSVTASNRSASDWGTSEQG